MHTLHTHIPNHKLHISNQVTRVNATLFSLTPENNFRNKIVTTATKLLNRKNNKKGERITERITTKTTINFSLFLLFLTTVAAVML